MSSAHIKQIRLGAVVVTYHPDEDFPARIRRVARQISAIVIVDNGSLPIEQAMLKRLASELHISLIFNPENVGIATALNQGMEWAIHEGCEWVLTLDQDTVVDENMVSSIWQSYHNLKPNGKIGILASSFRDRFGKRQFNDQLKSLWIARPVVITSGSFVCVEAFREAGKFRDDYFIDKVDTEYCLRLRSHGFAIYASVEPHMTQYMGNLTKRNFFGKKVRVYNYSPLRRYYISRNRIALAKTYLRCEVAVTVFEFRMMFVEVAWILLYEKRKREKMRAILRGLWHGFIGQMGKLHRPGPA